MPITTIICTFKAFARPQSNMETTMASLTAVPWWHCQNFNSVNQAFVSKKSTQLIKCPIIRTSPFSLISWLLISSSSNTCQVFNTDQAIRLFGIENNSFANDMVNMALKSSLFPRQPFQQLPTSTSTTARAFRGAFLERSTNTRVLVCCLSNFFSRPFLVLGCYRQIGTPKIYTNDIKN